jgi:hypothetical protein
MKEEKNTSNRKIKIYPREGKRGKRRIRFTFQEVKNLTSYFSFISFTLQKT